MDASIRRAFSSGALTISERRAKDSPIPPTSPETKLKGHGSGHYMSALALAYAAATNPSHKEILRRNITRMVNELRECQERTFVWSEELGRYLEGFVAAA